MGLAQLSEDRLLQAGQANRQRLLRVVQRNLPGRVPGDTQLVPNSTRSKAHHRAVAAGIQCESSSQGPGRQDTTGSLKPNKPRTNPLTGMENPGPSSTGLLPVPEVVRLSLMDRGLCEFRSQSLQNRRRKAGARTVAPDRSELRLIRTGRIDLN